MKFVYPVIHYKDDATTIEQAGIAYKAGADGVFLISHIGNDMNLIPLAIEIKEKYDFKVGINFLSNPAMFAAEVASQAALDMVWADYCGVSSLGLDDLGEELKEFAIYNPTVRVYASVAFKYQKVDPNPPLAAKNALDAGFVPITSGPATGYAPNVEKIKSMSENISCLGIASGMTVDNIDLFKPYLTHVLVSTGVSSDEYHFDPERLKLFIEKFKQED